MPHATYARCPGMFGELVQGRRAGRTFLVTLPVNVYAHAWFEPSSRPARLTQGYDKTNRFLEALSVEVGFPISGRLRLESATARGKGLASSSADLVAVGTAVLAAYGVAASEHPRLISRATRRVEPADGVMYAGIVSFDQHQSRLIESFGAVDLAIVGCLLPGNVDSCSYDSSKIRYTADELDLLDCAYSFARQGARTKDRNLLGLAASISAEINQRYLPKPRFAEVKSLAKSVGAAGIVVAHSGTAIGLLAPDGASAAQLKTMVEELSQLYGCKALRFHTDNMGPCSHMMEGRAAIL